MAPKTETAPNKTRPRITKTARESLKAGLIAKISSDAADPEVVKPQWVYLPQWEKVSEYMPLTSMLGLLESDIPTQQQAHLRKIAALNAVTLDRTAAGIVMEDFWREVDDRIGDEINEAASLPDDMRGVSIDWKNALADLLHIEVALAKQRISK